MTKKTKSKQPDLTSYYQDMFSSSAKNVKQALIGIANYLIEQDVLEDDALTSTLNAIESIALKRSNELAVRKAAVKSFAKIVRKINVEPTRLTKFVEAVKKDSELHSAAVTPTNQMLRLIESLRLGQEGDTIRGMEDTSEVPLGLKEACDALVVTLQKDRERFARRLENVLRKFKGFRPSNLEEGLEFTRTINSTLAKLGVVLLESKSGREATVTFRRIGTATNGAFMFRAGEEQVYGGVAFPSISVKIKENG
jgi:hypothetical protein